MSDEHNDELGKLHSLRTEAHSEKDDLNGIRYFPEEEWQSSFFYYYLAGTLLGK